LNHGFEFLIFEPQLLVGEASDAEARVYAALPRAGLPAKATLAGELTGPHCRYSQTLPARIRFVDRGPGPTLLAEAIVPDPCFWTPELPFLYSAELRLSTGDSISPTMIGIRRLGVRGTSIYLDARRCVVRGVRLEAAGIEDIKAAREAASALYVDEPGEAVLEEASREGVLLVVRLHELLADERLVTEVARIGRWPAVVAVVLDESVLAGEELRRAAPNALFAQRFVPGTRSVVERRPWADLLWWEIGHGELFQMPAVEDEPTIVFRAMSEAEPIPIRRKNCDRLQADLAGIGDFAGYFT
jgi:hypothetical protein